MATWMLTADQQLLNLDAVEFIDVLDVYPDDADPDAIDEGRVAPAYAELIAHLPSGEELVLYDDEEIDAVLHAFELVKAFVASGLTLEATFVGRVPAVQDLIDRASAKKN